MRYIDLNPRAANVVKDPAEFEFSSARAHLTRQPDPFFVLMMANWRHRFSNNPRRYREFLKETPREEWKRIEQGLRSGLPVKFTTTGLPGSSRKHTAACDPRRPAWRFASPPMRLN